MSAVTPSPLSGHTLTQCAGQLLAFGGLVPAASLAAEAAPALPGSQNVRPKTAAVSSKPAGGGGLVPTSALLGFAGGRWRALTPDEGSPAPSARSGHASCTLDADSMLVFGGSGSKQEKLNDAWQVNLSCTESKSSVTLELVLDAWTPERSKREWQAKKQRDDAYAAAVAAVAAAAAEAAKAEATAAAAAAAAAAAGGKGGKGAPPPKKDDKKGGGAAGPEAPVPPKEVTMKEVINLERIAQCVGGTLGGLPAACFEVRRAAVGAEGMDTAAAEAAEGDADTGLRVRLQVRSPLIALDCELIKDLLQVRSPLIATDGR